MTYTLLFIPFISMLACWLIIKLFILSIFRPYKPFKIGNYSWQGILPRVKETMTESLAKSISTEILNASFINEKLTDLQTLQNVMPAIEDHIDNFLNHKLKEAIPVISMFVGEKIISQLKELFLEELRVLFPSVMSQFIGNLSQSNELEKEIIVKLQSVSMERIEQLFFETFGNRLKQAELVFALTGLLAGAIQLLVTLAILHKL